MKRGRDDDAGREEADRKKKEASRRLLEACKQKGGDVEAARQAIADSADVDVREGWMQRFPLRYAADPEYGDSLEIVQMLIDAGCDVNQVNKTGETALMRTSGLRGNVSIVEALLRGGASPNVADDDGFTPMMP